MTLFTGTASGHQDLFDKLKAAAGGYGTISNQVTGSNVGDGTLTGVAGRASAVTETITLTAQAGGTVFNVVGSVTGAFDNANVDHTYDNGYFSFILNQGGITFDEGDDFTFDITQGEAKTDGVEWTVNYESEGGSDGDMYLQGQGNSSGDEVYLYFRHFKDAVSGYYNLESYAMTGYDSAFATSVTSQMGVSDAHYLYLSNSTISYWFMINSQRIIIVAKIGTVFESYYGGWYLQDGNPTELPQPYFIGGTGRDNTLLNSNTSTSHAAFFHPQTTNKAGQVRHSDGTWINVDTGNTYFYPWQIKDGNTTDIKPQYLKKGQGDGYLPLEASLVSSDNSGNNYGILDGIYWVSGDGNASENTFVFGSSTYLVVQDTFRTDVDDFMAVQME